MCLCSTFCFRLLSGFPTWRETFEMVNGWCPSAETLEDDDNTNFMSVTSNSCSSTLGGQDKEDLKFLARVGELS